MDWISFTKLDKSDILYGKTFNHALGVYKISDINRTWPNIPSVAPSVAPSIRGSAIQSVAPSAAQSVHGESTPAIHLEYDEPVNDTTTILQLTQEQLVILQTQQQQMLQDIEGQDGEMM